MNTRKDLMRAATMAVLLFLAGGTSMATADEVRDEANRAPSAQIEEASKEQARQANEAAVEEAAEAVEADIRVDLDIRLVGRTSVTFAGEV